MRIVLSMLSVGQSCCGHLLGLCIDPVLPLYCIFLLFLNSCSHIQTAACVTGNFVGFKMVAFSCRTSDVLVSSWGFLIVVQMALGEGVDRAARDAGG